MEVLTHYDNRAVATGFVRQHLDSIRQHSRHRVHFAAATYDAQPEFPLSLFDAVSLHFSVRLAFDWHLSPSLASRIAQFQGAKVLIIQDEYDMPLTACSWIRRLGIQTVLSCVPEANREAFYPAAAVPGVKFVQCLTGYIPDELPDPSRIRPLAERPVWLGYRGRRLPVWYGALAREKFEIGLQMRKRCDVRGLICDIEWSESKRLEESAWFEFVLSCRAMLGTESGSNVVDSDGAIRREVQAAIQRNPDITEVELYERYVKPHDNQVCMNQVSPKIFEAIATRTALVLFEGAYSGVIVPNEHFIPLRKDFLNADDVLDRLGDSVKIQSMADRAYRDVCKPELYGYGRLAGLIDEAIERHAHSVPPDVTSDWSYVAVRNKRADVDWGADVANLPSTHPVRFREPHLAQPLPYAPLTSGLARQIWLLLPESLRAAAGPWLLKAVKLARRRSAAVQQTWRRRAESVQKP